MRGVVALAIGLMFLATLPFSGLGADGDDVDGDDADETDPASPDLSLQSAVGTTTSHLVWSSKTTGDLAIRMELRFTAAEICGFRIVSAGWITSDPLFQFTANDRTGGGWTAVTQDQTLHAHAAGAAVRSGLHAGNLWAAEAFHGFHASGTMGWFFAGSSLTPFAQPPTNGDSLAFDLTCTGPFTITKIEAGRALVLQVPQFLSNGAGASALTLGVNAADGLTRAFSEPHVAFRMKTDSSFEGGLLQVNGPTSASQTTRLLYGDSDVTVDGPAGVWSMRLTRAALDQQDQAGFHAAIVLAGLQDVQSLDEAAAL